MNYHNFINAQEMTKKYPDTFEAPTMEELSKIKQDDFIKVCLNDERFWVKVIEVDEDEIRGEVDNNLFEGQPFNIGDIIACKKEHVYRIMEDNKQIYTITTLDNKEIPDCRCIGYYLDLETAKIAVLNNDCDMHEYSYTYCVIEGIKPGLYYMPKKEFWFKWNVEKNKYVAIKKPEKFVCISGFGIG